MIDAIVIIIIILISAGAYNIAEVWYCKEHGNPYAKGTQCYDKSIDCKMVCELDIQDTECQCKNNKTQPNVKTLTMENVV